MRIYSGLALAITLSGSYVSSRDLVYRKKTTGRDNKDFSESLLLSEPSQCALVPLLQVVFNFRHWLLRCLDKTSPLGKCAPPTDRHHHLQCNMLIFFSGHQVDNIRIAIKLAPGKQFNRVND